MNMMQHESSGRSDSRHVKTMYLHGVAVKPEETVRMGLMRVFGMGRPRAERVCRYFRRSPHSRMAERVMQGGDSGKRRGQIEGWLSQWERESNRRRKVTESIQRQMTRGTRRGIRIRQGRPVRGQRTSTNARTAKRLNSFRVG